MAAGAGTTPSRSGRHTTVHVAGGARYSTDDTQPWTTYLSLLALYTAAIMVTVVGLWLYNTLGRPPPPGPREPYRSYPFKLSASGYTQLLGCIHLNQQIEEQQKNQSTTATAAAAAAAAAALGPAASAAQQPQEGKQLAPQQAQGALPQERIICTEKGCFPESQVNKPQASPTQSTSTSTSIPSAQQQTKQETQQTATPAITTPVIPSSQLVFPEKFNHLKPTEPIPVDMLPIPLANFYSGPKPNEAVVKFHWVITSCERAGWGRYLTSTMLSGVFNGLFPATISLVWCNQYVPGEVPSILYNLRHSHSINIFFMSPKMHALKRPSTHKIYLSAMMVPTMLQQENLDLLITEDDILFAPDANARIASALAQYPRTANEPSLLYLYQSVNEPKLAHKGWEQAEDDSGDASLAHTGRVDQVNPWYTFGTQGILTNPQMTAILVRQILQVVQQGMLEDLLQDLMSRHWVLDVWKCNTPGSHCTYALALPCIVQHVGTSSAIFNNAGGLNKRFHSATNFPVRVQFPGFEDGW